MNKLFIHPTSTAEWLALIYEAKAEANCQVELHEELESYLVFLLIRFMQQPGLATSVLGLEFLEGSHAIGQQRQQQLKDVGDKCLLMSGLFPERAIKRRVQLSYFVNLGKTAYYNVSQNELKSLADLYAELSHRFIQLLDVLQAIRRLAPQEQGLDFWQALDLWEETGSEAAKDTLEGLCPDLSFMKAPKTKL